MISVEYDSWGIVPAPFNSLYDPRAKHIHREAIDSMVSDNFYDNHTREECAAEFRRRYDKIKLKNSLVETRL